MNKGSFEALLKQYNEGIEARKWGSSSKENPYEAGFEKYVDWFDGYKAQMASE